jgi:hypothetical protein
VSSDFERSVDAAAASGFARPLAQSQPIVDHSTRSTEYPPATVLLGPDSFEDNLDASHAYTRNIEIPAETLSVLSVNMRMRTKAYRYYVATVVGTANSGHLHTLGAYTGQSTGGELPPGVAHVHPFNGPTSTDTETTHTHTISVTPGIVETTTPTAMQVVVDGTTASATATSLNDFDLIPYLSKDAFGVILRGLHTVTFTPNGVGRVQATISGVLLLQSRGR